MTYAGKSIYESIPVMDVKDNVVISKRGDITFGWELTLPVMYSLTEEGYDDVVNGFASAAKILPPWTFIHRQDIFTYERYKGGPSKGFLSKCFNEHFEGRKYLVHHQYLFLTFSTKVNSLIEVTQSTAFGKHFQVALPNSEQIRQAFLKAEEFISIITGSGRIKARVLTTEDFDGNGTEAGVIDKYLMLGDETPIRSDVASSPQAMQVHEDMLLGFKISTPDCLPSEISDVKSVDEFFASGVNLYLSFGSAIGTRLACEHVVNQYILIPPQAAVLQDLDKRKKKMTSMRQFAENRVNAEQIEKFIEDTHLNGNIVCYSHMNVLCWGKNNEILDVKGLVSSALSQMGIVATQSLYDLPSLYFAGVPGGAPEVSKENYMIQELYSMLCMGINESFNVPIEGGTFQIIDRERNIPIEIDIQLLARKLGLIDNYNVFLLGPSGSGKSFFMNFFLRQCYDNGEHLFGIDVGDSYQGLCQIINEESGGRDGIYLTWDIEHPFTFNPFIGIEEWLDADGSLRQDVSGVNFFLSFITTVWAPVGGWSSDSMAVLEQVLTLFVKKELEGSREGLPVFDDFYKFLGEEIIPRIVPKYDKKGKVTKLPDNPIVIAYNPVRLEDFDLPKLMRALSSYAYGGAYSFLLNEKEPKDLFASRFTIFEVNKLSQGNPLFYSICVLCIMNAFEHKMQNAQGFKRLFVDEAWKAIANATMAPYLRGLWKTARKYQTSAMVITQELDDILSSEVIKESILQNSDTKVLLNQAKNRNRFEQLQNIMGLDDHQKQMILSMGLGHRTDLPFYTDCYIGMNNRCGIYSVESSFAEALAFESDKNKKLPLLNRAAELGSIRDAIKERMSMVK